MLMQPMYLPKKVAKAMSKKMLKLEIYPYTTKLYMTTLPKAKNDVKATRNFTKRPKMMPKWPEIIPKR